MASVRCGNCREMHGSVAEVKACYARPTLPTEPQPEAKPVPEFAANPASEKQLSFIKDLLAAREWGGMEDGRVSELAMDACDGKALGRSEASALIEALLKCPYAAKSKDDTAWPHVPAGRYALQSKESGIVAFYKVDKPTEGKWAGHVFVKLLVGGIGDWTEVRQSRNNVARILGEIHEMGATESAALFGQKARHCGQCMSPLSTVRSRAAGYGEKCASNHGWYYPSESEARRILKERGEDINDEEMADA